METPHGQGFGILGHLKFFSSQLSFLPFLQLTGSLTLASWVSPLPWQGKGVAKLFLSESWYHTSMCGREQFQFFPQLEAIATISVLAGQSLIGKKCVGQWESFERLLERAAHLNVDSPPGGSGLKQAIVHSVIFGYKYDWIPVNTCEYL